MVLGALARGMSSLPIPFHEKKCSTEFSNGLGSFILFLSPQEVEQTIWLVSLGAELGLSTLASAFPHWEAVYPAKACALVCSPVPFVTQGHCHSKRLCYPMLSVTECVTGSPCSLHTFPTYLLLCDKLFYNEVVFITTVILLSWSFCGSEIWAEHNKDDMCLLSDDGSLGLVWHK